MSEIKCSSKQPILKEFRHVWPQSKNKGMGMDALHLSSTSNILFVFVHCYWFFTNSHFTTIYKIGKYFEIHCLQFLFSSKFMEDSKHKFLFATLLHTDTYTKHPPLRLKSLNYHHPKSSFIEVIQGKINCRNDLTKQWHCPSLP